MATVINGNIFLFYKTYTINYKISNPVDMNDLSLFSF